MEKPTRCYFIKSTNPLNQTVNTTLYYLQGVNLITIKSHKFLKMCWELEIVDMSTAEFDFPPKNQEKEDLYFEVGNPFC